MNTGTPAHTLGLPDLTDGSQCHQGWRYLQAWSRCLAAWLLAVCLLLGAMGARTTAQAAYNYTETFMNDTAPGWSFYQSGTGPGPRLTAGASTASGDPEAGPTLDTAGQGWLRMTNLQGNQANSVTFANPVPSINNTITIEFEAVMWKPSGTLADGLTFFMYDASQPYSTGSYGGSLGYAQRSGQEGLAGGYFGVGLDTYGNFSNATEGRSGGAGFEANAIVVRGPGEEISGQWTGGYDYLAGTGGVNTTVGGSPAIAALSDSLGFNSSTRPDLTGANYRAYKITLDASNNLTVAMKAGVSGSFVDLFTANSIGTRPDNLRFGFTGSTGGLSQVSEIRNLSVSTTAGANDWTWDNSSGNSRWGTGGSDATNWDKNTNPVTDGGGYTPTVIFDNQFVTSNQTISVRDNNKTLHSMYFGGQYSYTLNTVGGRQLIFNSGTAGGTSVIGVYNNAAGNANHTINTQIVAQNSLSIQHYVNQALTFGSSINMGTNALTVDTIGTVNFNSNLNGSGTLTKNGSGQLTLAISNTGFTGATVINNGILRVNNASSLGSSGSGAITVNSGGTLQLNLASTTMANKALTLSGSGSGGLGALYNASGNNTYQGSISLASNASIGANAGTTLTVSGAISGSSTLTKVGSGTLTLTANNTGLTGTVVVNAGTLNLNGSGANKPLGNVSQVVINSGGTVVLAKANQIGSSAGMTLAGGTFNTQGFAQTLGTMTLSANSNLTLGSGALTLSNLVHTGGVLSVTGLNTTTSQWTVTSTVNNTMLGSIYFADLGIMGAFQLADGKIVAAPEPSTYALGLILVLCAGLYTYRSYLDYSKNHKAVL